LEQRYGGLPSAILRDQEMLDFYLPILRADLGLIENYRYQEKAPLSCPIFVSAGNEDTSVWADGLEDWRRHTTGDFEVGRYQGGHFYLSGESREAVVRKVFDKLTLIDQAIHG
jgi:surfactin synthase thioesterase subunit